MESLAQKHTNKTDEELVSLSLENEAFFGVLISRYQGKLISYIRRISNSSYEEAEDVLQETFIKVYYNLNGFDTNLKFSSWIYRITHNQVISHYRKKKARPQSADWETTEKVFKTISSEFDITGDLDQKYLKENLNKLIHNLSEKYQEVLILKFLEEKEYKEISDILKKPMGTIATLLSRAKKQLKKEIEKCQVELQ